MYSVPDWITTMVRDDANLCAEAESLIRKLNEDTHYSHFAALTEALVALHYRRREKQEALANYCEPWF